MRIIDCVQGSQEWIDARLGIPTSSSFHRVLTPRRMKLSESADSYLYELVAESMIGASLDPAVSQWMERGSEMEPQAIAFYELQREVDTTRVGFILNDEGSCGCSPDRLVGEDGGLEIKCPSAAVHVSYLMADPSKYNCQVQGAMWITGRKWWDFLSFNPELPPALMRVERDEEFIGKLEAAMEIFLDRLASAKKKMIALGYMEPETVLT